MAYGMIPARGQWEERWLPVTSTATFLQGSLVQYDPALNVREYLSTDSSVLGISATSSTNSRLYNGVSCVMVYIPRPGCTAMSDLTTGVTQSGLSLGNKVCGYKQGNIASYASTVIGISSRFSGIFTVVGMIDSARSQVEVAFNIENTDWYSASSFTAAS